MENVITVPPGEEPVYTEPPGYEEIVQEVEKGLAYYDPEKILECMTRAGYLHGYAALELADAEAGRVQLRESIIEELQQDRYEYRCPDHGVRTTEEEEALGAGGICGYVEPPITDGNGVDYHPGACGLELEKHFVRKGLAATKAEPAARADQRYVEYNRGVEELRRRARYWEVLYEVLKLRAKLAISPYVFKGEESNGNAPE